MAGTWRHQVLLIVSGVLGLSLAIVIFLNPGYLPYPPPTKVAYGGVRASLEAIGEHYARLRLNKIKLDRGILWMAIPDWADSSHPHFGADWYEQAWTTNRFNYRELCGQICLERILAAVPCHNNSMVFQAGAHLAVFPMMATVLGCQGLAIEANPVHLPIINLNRDINGMGSRFRVINAIVGAKDSPEGLRFGAGQELAGPDEGGVMVPMVALDSVIQQHYPEGIQVNLGIIDTEGFEHNVLAGAAQLVKRRQVAVFVIEVWFIKHSKVVREFPGLQLLLDEAYVLYNGTMHPVGVSDMVAMAGTYCKKGGSPRASMDLCLMDIIAIRPDVSRQVLEGLKELA